MAEETIFSKIIRKEIPADIVYQDDLVTAFRDINPRAPTHILIIPNNLIPTVDDVTSADEGVLGRLFTAASKIAREEGIAEDGYRLIVNLSPAWWSGGLSPAHAPARRSSVRANGRRLVMLRFMIVDRR